MVCVNRIQVTKSCLNHILQDSYESFLSVYTVEAETDICNFKIGNPEIKAS